MNTACNYTDKNCPVKLVSEQMAACSYAVTADTGLHTTKPLWQAKSIVINII